MLGIVAAAVGIVAAVVPYILANCFGSNESKMNHHSEWRFGDLHVLVPVVDSMSVRGCISAVAAVVAAAVVARAVVAAVLSSSSSRRLYMFKIWLRYKRLKSSAVGVSQFNVEH